MVRHSPLAAFVLLAYAVSWWTWPLYALKVRNVSSPLFPWGPVLAGLIISAVLAGRPGVQDFLGRIVRWRAGLRWYAMVFLLPLVLALAAASANGLLPTFLFIVVFIGLGEEPGWRGFALPRLKAVRSSLAATAIVGVIRMFTGDALLRLWWLSTAAWCGMALAVLLATGWLRRPRRETVDPAALGAPA